MLKRVVNESLEEFEIKLQRLELERERDSLIVQMGLNGSLIWVGVGPKGCGVRA